MISGIRLDIQLRLIATFVFMAMVISGCTNNVPNVPTVPPVPTNTPLPEPTASATTSAPPTLPPTWTPHPSRTPKPTVPAPVQTANPIELTANAPIAVSSNGNGASVLTITEAQLNAALKRLYDDAPLAGYPEPPHVTLGDGALVMTLLIVPQNAPPDSNPQTMTLVANLAIYSNALELQPTDLSPLNVGVTTRQVKLAHVLLIQTLNEIARTAAGDPASITFNYVNIEPGDVLLTVVGN